LRTPTGDPRPARTLTGTPDLARPVAGLAASRSPSRVAHRIRERSSDLLLTTVALLVVTGPLLFTRNGFASDFTNHLWLTWVAARGLARTWHPEYFINAPGLGTFYPHFAFYGGPLDNLTGALTDALGGHPVPGFLVMTVLGVLGCYLGIVWLGRQFGLAGWMAHVPALTAITAAYYVTELYGRGGWTELMATSAIAPMFASGLHLVRSPRWRPGSVVVFAASVVIFTGSHPITLLWGTLISALDLLIIWLALGLPRRLPYRRLVRVALLGVASTAINAWALVPGLLYTSDVVASNTRPTTWRETSVLNSVGVQLNPFRFVPRQMGKAAFYLESPVWFLGWGLLVGVLLLRRDRSLGRLRRVWFAALLAVALPLGLILYGPIWKHIHYPFDQIQFPYRLGTYVLYGAAGLVLVGALTLQRSAHARSQPLLAALRGGLVLVVAVSVGLCLWQDWIPESRGSISYANRGHALVSPNSVPRSWYDPGVYRDVQAPVVSAAENRVLIIEPDLIRGDRFAEWLTPPPGPEPIQTNIGGGAYLVHISGLQRIGRNPEGYTVVRRPDGGRGPVRVVIETAHTLPLELGWVLSLLAIAAVAGVILFTGVRTLRTPGSAMGP
jgi:hypothetical protein